MIFFLSYQTANCQARMCLEQYYYTGYSGSAALVSKASYQSGKGWYGELRYNYDEARSYSLYGGKNFSKRNDQLSWAITPFAGLVLGQLKGGSVGANIAMDYKKLFFSTASQYTFSAEDRTRNFFFSWSELGYQATKHIYGGLAFQETHNDIGGNKWEPGIQIGILYKEWTFPVYVFDPISAKRHFVLGAIWEKKW